MELKDNQFDQAAKQLEKAEQLARTTGSNYFMSSLYAMATFYKALSLKPKGRHIIKLCDGTACHVKGSTPILDALRTKLNIKPGQDSSDDMLFTVDTVSCLGACGLAPVMVVNDEVHGQVRPADVDKIIDAVLAKEKTQSN